MNAQTIFSLGIMSLFTVAAPAVNADTYSTSSGQGFSPVTEVHTTTVDSGPITVVRESPIHVEPSTSPTIILQKKRYLFGLPWIPLN